VNLFGWHRICSDCVCGVQPSVRTGVAPASQQQPDPIYSLYLRRAQQCMEIGSWCPWNINATLCLHFIQCEFFHLARARTERELYSVAHCAPALKKTYNIGGEDAHLPPPYICKTRHMHAELLIRTELLLLLLREQERSTCKSDGEEKEGRRLTRIILRVKKPSWETARRANICHVTESQNKYQLMTISEQPTAFPELCSLGSPISLALTRKKRPTLPGTWLEPFKQFSHHQMRSRTAANLWSVFWSVAISFMLRNKFTVTSFSVKLSKIKKCVLIWKFSLLIIGFR
jgi:hypothetical protein